MVWGKWKWKTYSIYSSKFFRFLRKTTWQLIWWTNAFFDTKGWVSSRMHLTIFLANLMQEANFLLNFWGFFLLLWNRSKVPKSFQDRDDLTTWRPIFHLIRSVICHSNQTFLSIKGKAGKTFFCPPWWRKFKSPRIFNHAQFPKETQWIAIFLPQTTEKLKGFLRIIGSWMSLILLVKIKRFIPLFW